MSNYMYVALFEWDSDSNAYAVSFPDLPGCVSFGGNVAEALQMAKDALEGHLLVAEEEGDVIPTASDFKDFIAFIRDKDFIQYVEADTIAARKREDFKTVNKMVTLPNYLVQLGKENNINFSALLQEALRNELNI